MATMKLANPQRATRPSSVLPRPGTASGDASDFGSHLLCWALIGLAIVEAAVLAIMVLTYSSAM